MSNTLTTATDIYIDLSTESLGCTDKATRQTPSRMIEALVAFDQMVGQIEGALGERQAA